MDELTHETSPFVLGLVFTVKICETLVKCATFVYIMCVRVCVLARVTVEDKGSYNESGISRVSTSYQA
jgi:hypothetical protein